MNINSFVQIDDSLAFNPGYITRVLFGYERTTICRVTVSYVDGVSITLADERLASFLEWWESQATVLTKGSMMTYYLTSTDDLINEENPDEQNLH